MSKPDWTPEGMPLCDGAEILIPSDADLADAPNSVRGYVEQLEAICSEYACGTGCLSEHVRSLAGACHESHDLLHRLVTTLIPSRDGAHTLTLEQMFRLRFALRAAGHPDYQEGGE